MLSVPRLTAPATAADEQLKAALGALQAMTIHRLLGYRPGSRSRFRHDAEQRLPHDVVIVDETSMVSLSLMARLIEALRPEARLVLVGDAGQLASIEAGAVLGDIVGDGVVGEERRPGISVLVRGHRYGDEIAEVAAAIRAGDADRVIELLRNPAGAQLNSVRYCGGGASIDTTTLASAGTYTVHIDPLGTDTGSVTVAVSTVVTDLSIPVTADGSSNTATLPVGSRHAAATPSGSSVRMSR